MVPELLKEALRPITVVAGHYGVGKTNFSCNLALDLAAGSGGVTLVDLDIVNPYFRASEQRNVLERGGVRVIAPVFAEAGSSLDVPSLRGSIAPALQGADRSHRVVLDVGGDDAGAVALGRFAAAIGEGSYAMLGVLNALRQEVRSPAEAVENLQAIEAACGLRCTALVDNTHLKGETSADILESGFAFARETAALMGLPLAAVTVPCGMEAPFLPENLAYPVEAYVRNPWE